MSSARIPSGAATIALHMVLLATHEWAPSRTDAGAAAPVAVLVHGITGWWQTWWRVGPELAKRGWRVIAIDLRGHGESPSIAGVATAETLADDIAATIDGLRLAPVDVLMAHSLGAAVSMELVQRRPEITRRLVLEDPPGQTRADDVEFQANLEREVLAARSDPEAEIRRELAENPGWLPEDAHQDVKGRAMCDLEGILRSLRANTGVRVTQLAPLIARPALYLVAAADRSALGDQREPLLRSLPPHSKVVEFDCGHTIHHDRVDAYLAAIDRWTTQ